MELSDGSLVADLRAENAALKQQLEGQLLARQPAGTDMKNVGWEGCGLNSSQVSRYSRQLVLPSFGPQAQARLCQGSVLIIGAGGLGSPAALYLAAAGVGKLGIVDTDALELSNLHRQIAHQEASVGHHKAASAAASCRALNSSIQVVAHEEGLLPQNALELVAAYDVVVDASDNAPTRYLASDACCVTGKPLVSGAALGMDGQLSTLCVRPDGPCYRCLYPEAPALASCRRCGEAGVLGVAPGIIGTLQALEAIKLLTGIGQPLTQRLLLLDCLSTSFRSIKLRQRQKGCASCGDQPTITAENLAEYDYRAFTGQPFNDAAPPSLQLIPAAQRLHPQDLAQILSADSENTFKPSVQPQAGSESLLQPPAAAAAGAADLPLHGISSSAASSGATVAALDAQSLPTGSTAGDQPSSATCADTNRNMSPMQNVGGQAASQGRLRAKPLVVDVRPKEQFAAAHLPGSVNIPYQGPHKPIAQPLLQLCQSHQSAGRHGDGPPQQAAPSDDADATQAGFANQRDGQGQGAAEIFVICRRGNDSQEVVQQLRSAGFSGAVDIIGGLTGYSKSVDPTFPTY